MQIRVSLVATIYSKILRLPSLGSGATKVTSGHVTNLASNDVERFLLTAVYCNFIVLGPIEALLVLVVGLYTIGPVFCAGYALLCLLVPFQFWLSRRFAALRDRIAKKTDTRISLVSQAVYGARVMKQCGFETMFLDRITKHRHGEIQQLQTTSRLKALNEAIYYFSNAVVATFIFSIHVALGGTLTPEIVYTTLTLLGILQFTLTKHIPNAIMGLSECYVSSQRLQAFLDLPEITSPVGDSVIVPAPASAENQTLLSLSNVTCYWNMHGSNDPTTQSLKVALSDVSLDLERRKLYCVIGKIGSGKSALLQAFSGELPAAAGSIKSGIRSMTYAAQEAWIMDGSIRDNILMNLAFDPQWYEEVIDACALRHDLLHFPNGDETIVGDRGVQCSGGQKARIGLARAFYKQDSDIILLDDPLSAVDAKVAKTIFFSAIQKLGVQRGKCVVLVTHQHQFVGMADQCILMDDGKVAHVGTFEECQALSTFSNNNQLQMVEENDNEGTEENGLPSESVTPFKETQEEKRVTGVVKVQTWKAYVKAFGGYWMCALLVFLFMATQGTLLVTFVLLGRWGGVPADDQRTSKWFAIAGGVTSALVVLSIVRALLSFAVLIRGSGRLHDAMTTAVLRAKISFFDTNPLGRILNRFSADVGIADEMLPRK
jgi:ATP-binding cassette subfamily C (CFTR/MRP) protein 4